MKFSDLSLHPNLQAGIQQNGFEDCTPIQEKAIPLVLAGKDLAGLAQTGTGKTAAFLLPLMNRILLATDAEAAKQEGTPADASPSVGFPEWRPTNYVLVLVPTRELAEQVGQNIESLGKIAGFKWVAVYGGTAYEGQKKALREGVQFVVATPGRLIDLQKERIVDLSQVRAIVFDEADRMFDMGFKDDMKYILKRVPIDRQFLVFSATLNFDVLHVAYEFGANPVEIDISRDQAKAENVDDQIFHVGVDDKPRSLLSLLKKNQPQQAIVFSNFKNNVERIAEFLNRNGVAALGISSLLTQAQRNRVMVQFRTSNGQSVLVATDVAARGLDIKGVDLVVNYELPDDPENYVHRIGRTGRAGAKGTAFSLVGDRDVEALERIQQYVGHKLAVGWLEDGDLLKEFVAMSQVPTSPRLDRPQKFQSRPPRARDGGRPRRDGERRDAERRDGGRRDGGRPRPGAQRLQKGPRPAGTTAEPRSASTGQLANNPERARNGEGGGDRSRSRRRRPRQRSPQSRFQREPNTGASRAARPPTGVSQPPPNPSSSGLGQRIGSFFRKLFS